MDENKRKLNKDIHRKRRVDFFILVSIKLNDVMLLLNTIRKIKSIRIEANTGDTTCRCNKLHSYVDVRCLIADE